MASAEPLADITSGLPDFLQRTSPYNAWSMGTLATLCADSNVAHYEAGELIARYQAEPAQIFLVGQGVLDLTVSLANGHDLLLTHLHTGALLGLTDAFGDRTPGEEQIYRALSRATLWLFPLDTFRACMAQDSAMAETVVRILATRLGRLVDEIANTSLLPAKARVARWLLTRAPRINASEPQAMHAGEAVALSQMQLARMLGLSRQSVGLFLREFEAAGHLRLSRNRFELLQPEGLHAIVHGAKD